MKTKSELKKLKKFPCTRIFHGKYHAENHDELKKDFIEALIQNCPDFVESELKETSDSLSWGTRFIFKPKMKKETKGFITFRSNDYFFEHNNTASYGPELKELTMTEKGFYITIINNDKLEYILGE